MTNFADLSEALAQAASVRDEKRSIRIMAVLTRALHRVKFNTPILVGGSAAEFWSHGRFSTGDIDALLYTPHDKVTKVMTGLGFVQKGKDWHHETLNIWIEFPATSNEEPWFETDSISVEGVEVKIVALESIILDRLASFATGYSKDGAIAAVLMQAGGNTIDWNFLEQNIGYCAPHDPGILKRMRDFVERFSKTPLPEGDELEDALYGLKTPLASGTLHSEVNDDEES